MKVRYVAAGVFAAGALLLIAHSGYKRTYNSYRPPILADFRCVSRTDCRAASEKFNQVVHAKYPRDRIKIYWIAICWPSDLHGSTKG